MSVITLVAFDRFFPPLCVFKWVLKLSAQEDVKSHWLHLFDFSPLWVLKCVLKWLTRENAESHWLHLFDFSLPSVPLILPKSRCSRFRSISRSVLALAIFVSNWYVKRLHLIWIGRIETESEFHQYFLNISKQPVPKNSYTWTQPVRSKAEKPYLPDPADKMVWRIFTHEQ